MLYMITMCLAVPPPAYRPRGTHRLMPMPEMAEWA
jgi:hypothetical protein